MSRQQDRLDLRLNAQDKEAIRRAADAQGIPVATFVRQAALREARGMMDHPSGARDGSVAARMRGTATAGMTTEEILQLTRGE